MDLQEYQKFTGRTVKNDTVRSKWYLGLGLTGEAGEVANEIKKFYRDGGEPDVTKNIKLELGDVLWYWVRLCEAFGFELEDVMQANVDKLKKRYQKVEVDEARKSKQK